MASRSSSTRRASYLFSYAIDLPAGAREIRLPSEKALRILAVTAVREPRPVSPASVLYAADLDRME